ncbi:MAG: carbohydrate porin [Pirellulales bacterium]|nr:carbohydrate porin [Pirellulales bacterium]
MCRTLLIFAFGFSVLAGINPAQKASAECCCCREYLTGDMFGIRPGLAEHGVVADFDLTQFYQDVASGGARRKDAYGGKLDYFFTFAKGLAVMHAENRFGEDVILDAAGLAPVNANMLYPELAQTTAITGLQFNLPLTTDQQWIGTFGKINTLDLFNAIYPQTGRGVDGFMNGSAFLPLTIARTVPLSFLGAGMMKMHDKQIQGALLVYDSHNSAMTSGFDQLFDNGANIAGMWRFFTEIGGLPGSHLFLGTWASGEFTSLDETGWEFIPDVGVIAPQETGSWSLLYILEQKLWGDPCNQGRNIGILSQWGLSDQETSPYAWACNVSLQGQGLIARREQDTVGIGYFYSGLSNDFKNLLNPPLRLSDLQGVELYYNAAITRWFHLTADLQVVEPADSAHDTAVVFGLRAKIDL